MASSSSCVVLALSTAVALTSCTVPARISELQAPGALPGQSAAVATGELRLRLVWPPVRAVSVIPTRTARYKVTVTGSGISSPVTQTITREGSGSETTARLPVPAGDDRTVTVEAQDLGGALLAKGFSSGVRISAGQYTPVTVTLAWQVGHVAGRVLDGETGQGVAAVTVSVTGRDRSATTGADGEYLIEDIPTGTQELTLTKDRYATIGVKTNISIAAGGTANAPDLVIYPSHWFLQLSGVSSRLNAIRFVNSYAGWAVGQSGVILKTVDAGQNWARQSTGTTDDFEDVFFLDEQNGWAVGGTYSILKTTDGGLNWAKINMPLNQARPRCLFVLNTLVFIGTIWYDNSLRSDDGGANWQKLPGMAKRAFFISSDRGWRVDGDGKLWFTSTGGQSWSSQVTPGTSGQVVDVAFKDDVNGWAATEAGHILRTANGGASWAVFGQAPGAINRFSFADDSVGFGVADSGVSYRTADGGKTWATHGLDSGLKTNLYGIVAKGPSLAWAVGENGRIVKY